VIREAKTLLEGIIKKTVPGITVVKSAAEEANKIMSRKFPLVALITNPGTFDDSEARTVRYFEGEPKQYRERYVRGHRNLPILIRCWADGEEKADELSSSIIPEIPSQWEYDGFGNHVRIEGEEHSDHASSTNKTYASVIVVTFSATAARKPEPIPYFTSTEMVDGEIINRRG
jgi:hypothetical protein